VTAHNHAWSVRAGCVSEVGRVRQQNEDQCLIALEHDLFIVSDGMGAQQAGEVASKAVVTVLPPLLLQHMARIPTPSSEARERVLREALAELSQRLRAESAGRVGLQGMGATVALAWLHETVAHLAHVGDSRIYLFREAQLKQLTEDHSVIALLLGSGEITPEEAQTHPARGRLSRYIGMEGEVSPDVQTVHLQEGDRLLLCSDGLTNMIPDTQIVQILHANAEAGAACRDLVRAANAAGGTDNITALVIDCG
jgi:serine/threonine protein phosphatase PrpC